MALQTLIKVSGVTNLSDARYCAGMGVDLLGFSMDADAPDYVDLQRFTEIRGWVTGVQIVGETGSIDPDQIEQLLQTYQPDLLQVDDAAMIPYLSTFDKPIILRIDLALLTLNQLETLGHASLAGAEYVLLEHPRRGFANAVHLDEDLIAAIRQLASRHPVLLGVGVTAANAQQLLTDLPVRGLALRGGDEERPGNKDFGTLMDILEAIEAE